MPCRDPTLYSASESYSESFSPNNDVRIAGLTTVSSCTALYDDQQGVADSDQHLTDGSKPTPISNSSPATLQSDRRMKSKPPTSRVDRKDRPPSLDLQSLSTDFPPRPLRPPPKLRLKSNSFNELSLSPPVEQVHFRRLSVEDYIEPESPVASRSLMEESRQVR